VLLQKTLLNIEGLGRQLYPELNLWETAKPFLEDWLKRQYSPVNVIKQLQRDAPAFVHHASQLPEVIPQFLATQREALKTTPREDTQSDGSPLFIGSGIATLIVSLLAGLSNPWYVAIGTLLVIVGLIRRRK
jgi:ubiquinone biosynthesis protein